MLSFQAHSDLPNPILGVFPLIDSDSVYFISQVNYAAILISEL